ncbi:hypothetical protein [Arthrobacter sp. 4R501]|uniref:hypothetical protein n=1 Tax=Arthrobacter sp. 4R501 TaxID=2058886 RepID=UPI000CE45C4F|nr:hypothetical protein [Arthrobacter sp. 4R501]
MSEAKHPESGPALSINTNRYRFALDYLHATNPETRAEVVFVPGEALPDWAMAEQAKRESDTLAELNLLPLDEAPQSEGKRPVKGR